MFLIVDCGSTKVPKIEEILASLNCSYVTKRTHDDFGDIESYHGIIISGAPILVTEIDTTPYLEKFDFLNSTNVPVLGICFGHQILGMVNGAVPSRCEETRTPIDITLSNSPLFIGFDTTEEFDEDHCEMISLPHNFIPIASSALCPIEGIQHKNKKLFGVQFHPETSKKNGGQLFQNFIQICSE